MFGGLGHVPTCYLQDMHKCAYKTRLSPKGWPGGEEMILCGFSRERERSSNILEDKLSSSCARPFNLKLSRPLHPSLKKRERTAFWKMSTDSSLATGTCFNDQISPSCPFPVLPRLPGIPTTPHQRGEALYAEYTVREQHASIDFRPMLPNTHTPGPSDIYICTYPKSGTTLT